ncbi:hypothetical protein [Leminorella grimontii]|uniref:hypothetical protein n=1 Tax=Leminorella grimontii TaxID=82981 RepID=UPI00322063F7
MINKLEWLENKQEYFLENDGIDLYYLISTMLKEQKMSFLQFLYDASRGIGCTVHEGLEYVLDQDWDNPEEFDEVSFLLGDYESSTLSPKRFVELMQVIADSYIDAHQNDKKSVENNMAKLKERYL